MKTTTRSLATLVLLPLTFGALAIVLSGCSKQEDAPPANAGYYTGPKNAKNPPPAGETGAKGGTEK